jgi:nucleotide-binding universal stress UspA family protein
MYHRILIPLDGSPLAEQVLPLAKLIAARFVSSVVLFRAIEPIHERIRVDGELLSVEDQVELVRTSAMEYLTTVLHGFTAAGIPAEGQVQVGPAAPEILQFAESAHVDLIAMATHGRTGLQRWVYGSVADKVLSSAHVPMLLVRATATPSEFAPITRILVPLDGSALAERALPSASQWAKAFEAEIILFRVWQPLAFAHDGFAGGMSLAELDNAVQGAVEEYLRQKTQEVEGQGVRVDWVTQLGPVADRILEAAEKHGANLVVMSTHGRSGIGRWVMGSTADRVLRTSHIPVLLVRSGAAVEQADHRTPTN